jgi:5-methylcytosine-specific restriction endonuclease McrA
MPIDYSQYPPHWKELRLTVLERAGNRCEGSSVYPDCRAENYQPHPVTGSKVILTIAHLDQYKGDNIERLRAWCQRCHLTYDGKHHAANAARTRQKKKYGENTPLFTEEQLKERR